MADIKRSFTQKVSRKESILTKTFRRAKFVDCTDISQPLSLRHTAHVGASGHNFGDLSFLEPGGRVSKSNGLDCHVIYDSPVLRKTESIPSIYYESSVHGITSDSGNGSELGASELDTLDKALTEDDLSSLDETELMDPEYFTDFTIDMGPSLMDDVMKAIDRMSFRRRSYRIRIGIPANRFEPSDVKVDEIQPSSETDKEDVSLKVSS